MRGGHRSAVTRLIHKTEEKIGENGIADQELNTAIDTLERKRNVLGDLDQQILDVTEAESMEQEILDTDDYTFSLEMTLRKFKDLLSERKRSTPEATVSDISNNPTNLTNISATPGTSAMQDTNQNTNPYRSNTIVDDVNVHVFDNMRQPGFYANQPQRFYHKLPTLDLPTFSGDILSWQTFWESFESSVHANPALTNIQKFTYLKAQLRSEAERCISGLALTNPNYDQAITLLKDRFGQQNKIIDAHMQKLIDLPSPTLSLSSLRNFYDKIETSIRVIRTESKYIWSITYPYHLPKIACRCKEKFDSRTWKLQLGCKLTEERYK